jgi:hypothetical protein
LADHAIQQRGDNCHANKKKHSLRETASFARCVRKLKSFSDPIAVLGSESFSKIEFSVVSFLRISLFQHPALSWATLNRFNKKHQQWVTFFVGKYFCFF